MKLEELNLFTAQQKRMAIAEACGWTNCLTCSHPDTIQGLPPTGYKESAVTRRAPSPDENDGDRWFWLPDYLSDLNAMREAETGLPRYMLRVYEHHLQRVVSMATTDADWCSEESNFPKATTYPWHATAAQRANAFLLTVEVGKNDPVEDRP